MARGLGSHPCVADISESKDNSGGRLQPFHAL
jgi:hypothetical protein